MRMLLLLFSLLNFSCTFGFMSSLTTISRTFAVIFFIYGISSVRNILENNIKIKIAWARQKAQGPGLQNLHHREMTAACVRCTVCSLLIRFLICVLVKFLFQLFGVFFYFSFSFVFSFSIVPLRQALPWFVNAG